MVSIDVRALTVGYFKGLRGGFVCGFAAPDSLTRENPVEHVFGVLENYWNGDPLDSVQKALGMAEGITYKGVHPTAIGEVRMRPQSCRHVLLDHGDTRGGRRGRLLEFQ